MANPENLFPFRDRKTWLIESRSIKGWNLKIYGICAEGRELHPQTIEAALQYASMNVAWPKGREGYGFVILHFGQEAVWLLVDLWVDDILRHFLYQAPCSEPERFTSAPDDGTMACVWELAIMMHERNAWIEHNLSRPTNPDYAAYLADSIRIESI